MRDDVDVLVTRKAHVIEPRFFCGLSVEETASALKVSVDTVMRDWTLAKESLMRELRARPDGKGFSAGTPKALFEDRYVRQSPIASPRRTPPPVRLPPRANAAIRVGLRSEQLRRVQQIARRLKTCASSLFIGPPPRSAAPRDSGQIDRPDGVHG